MSLKDEIHGSPRQDRHPYLPLGADTARGQVEVSEGAMWQGAGTHTSGRARSWQLSEITKEAVLRRSSSQAIVAILRRAAT
jgi:hypothetical protein